MSASFGRLAAFASMLFVLVWLASATAQSPGPPSRTTTDTRRYHVYHLRHVPAASAERLLRKLLGDTPATSVAIASDERTNSVIVSAAPDNQAGVEALLQRIDTSDQPDATPELRVIPLHGLAPDNDLEAGLRMVVQRHGSSRFVLDHSRRVVVVYGSPEASVMVARLLELLREAAHTEQAGPAAGAAAKRFSMQFRNAPWVQVFQWLSDQTGLVARTGNKPTGRFTFTPPRQRTSYTLTEVIDILNEALQKQDLLLVRGTGSFVILAADEVVEQAVAPRRPIKPADLVNYGNTEILQMMVPVRIAPAEDLVPEIKKLMGPFGRAMAIQDHLLLIDTAGNLRRIYQVIEEIDKGGARPASNGRHLR